MKCSRLSVAPKNRPRPSQTWRNRKSYRFGPFLVDRRSACLRRDGVVVPLRPKTFDVLVYLAQHPGRLVPKAELIDNVWQNVNVTENSLVQCIKDIRQALHDDTQTIIETVSKRGYLFALPVVAIDGRIDPHTLSAAARRESRAAVARSSLHRGAAVRQYERRSRSGLLCRRHFRGPDHRPVPHPLAVRHRAQLDLCLQGPAVDVSRSRASSASAMCSKAASPGRQAAARQRPADRRADRRRTIGPSNTTANSATSSRCRMRSPATSSPRSSRGCWPRRAFAHFRVPPAISAPGSWWRARKPMSGGSTAMDNEAAIDALQRRRRCLSGLRAGAKPARRSAWCFRHIMAGSIATTACWPAVQHIVRAIALDDCDPWAQIALGYWSMMERRTEESIAAFRRAVSLNPSSAAAHCYLSHGLAFSGQ